MKRIKRVCGRIWTHIDSFVIPGEPIAKGRPRVTSTHTYTPKKTKDAQKRLSQFIEEQCKLELKLQGVKYISAWPYEYARPIYMEVHFYHKRPKRLCRKKDPVFSIPKETKPDLDNLVKLVKDALNDCNYWADDKHNTTILADKRYVAKGEEPRTEIYIYIKED